MIGFADMGKNKNIEVKGIITRDNISCCEHFDTIVWNNFDKGLRDWKVNNRPYTFFRIPFHHSFSRVNDELLLSLDAWAYGLHRKLRIEIGGFRVGKRLTIYDYEACVSSGCYKDNMDLIYLDRSGQMQKKDCCDAFLQLCKDVFGVEPPNKCEKFEPRYRIGNCAEQHVINGLMKELDSNTAMKVSKGVRPRTMTFIENCANCKAVMSKI